MRPGTRGAGHRPRRRRRRPRRPRPRAPRTPRRAGPARPRQRPPRRRRARRTTRRSVLRSSSAPNARGPQEPRPAGRRSRHGRGRRQVRTNGFCEHGWPSGHPTSRRPTRTARASAPPGDVRPVATPGRLPHCLKGVGGAGAPTRRTRPKAQVRPVRGPAPGTPPPPAGDPRSTRRTPLLYGQTLPAWALAVRPSRGQQLLGVCPGRLRVLLACEHPGQLPHPLLALQHLHAGPGHGPVVRSSRPAAAGRRRRPPAAGGSRRRPARTWRACASRRPISTAALPPTPASTSSKRYVGTGSVPANTTSTASITRDSSPPDAPLAMGRGGAPGCGASSSSTSSAPDGP